MRNRFNLAIIIATLLTTMTSTIALAAAPPLPSSFYGRVTLADQNVQGCPAMNRAVWSRIHAAWFVTCDPFAGVRSIGDVFLLFTPSG